MLLVFHEPPGHLCTGLASFSLAVTGRELTASHASPTSFHAAITFSSSAISTPSFLAALSPFLGSHPE